jgi:predicted nucleotidyltransferase
MLNVKEISKILEIETNLILAVYIYGSRIYGTNNKDSDWDYSIVVEDTVKIPNMTIELQKMDFNLYQKSNFIEEIKNHYMPVLENIFSPSTLKFEKINFSEYFELDLGSLRVGVSSISSKCFHYSKILWNKELDFKKSKKNVFHSIRYLLEGIQIAKNGKIVDFTEANEIYFHLLENNYDSFDELKKEIIPKVKKLNKVFFELAPKRIIEINEKNL